MSERIAFVGAGFMGSAMIRGLIARGAANAADIVVNEIDASRRDAVVREHGVVAGPGLPDGVRDARAVVLAVKPQSFGAVATDIRSGLSDDTLVVSIMAGVTIGSIRDALGKDRIIRAMPNLPAQVGRGVVVWATSAGVSSADLALAERILGALGTQIQVSVERDIDAATAVHGSGPAYVYLIAEAWIEAAVAAGLTRPLAVQLVRETLAGSVALWSESGQSLESLRHAVTSPGGTTAAALQVFEDYRLRSAFHAAVQAALRRARELG